jgi:flagellar protein FliO/FliZ
MSVSLRLRYPAIWLFASARVLAAAESTVIYPAGSPAGTAATGAGAQLGGALGPMTLVVALLLAAAGGWVLWRQHTNRVAGRDGRLLAVDETRALGNRQYLVVASYDGKKFLLGVCPGRIEMLSPLGEGTADGKRIA